jgi:hypothetical protein
MGSRSIILPSPELVSAGSGTDFRVLRRHRMTAALLLIAFALQPLGLSAEPAVPLSHFAPKPSASNPFLWVSPRPTTPFLAPRPANGGWAEAWQQTPRRTPAFAIKQAPTENWQPAPLDENAPLTPPDGMPPVLSGPLPGIDNVAGNCVITGEVSDATSLNPVAGAFVDVAGSGRTAETDAKGRFTIGGLPAGTFTLEATKLGYFTESSVITTLEGQPAETRFGLRLKPADDMADETMLEEETIVGEYQGESQGDFNLALTAEAPVLTSGLNRDDFAKTAVSDAGEAISKVSGANIVDGKYAVVRGLADRYVTTTFNGAQIASADPSRKAVQLDMFPTNVIEAINVAKTFSPEMSADFGGAAIDIVTRAFPEERILNFKFKIETNSETDDVMFVRPDGDLGFFGEAGDPMPNVLETRNPDTGEIVFLPSPNTSADELKSKMTTLHNSRDLLPEKDDANLGYSYGLTYGETFALPNGMKLGVMTAFGQKSGDSNNTSDINNQDRSFIRDDYDRGVELSAFASAALEINELNRLQLTYFNKHTAQDTVTQGRRIEGTSSQYGRIVDPSIAPIVRDTYGADAVYFREFWDIGTLTRDLEIFQATGEHQMSEDGIQVDWGVTESNSTEDRPHSSHFEYGLLDFSAQALAPYVTLANQNLDALIRDNASAVGLDPATATWANSRDYLVGLLGEETVASIETSQGLPLVNGDLPPVKTIYPVAPLVGQAERTVTAFRRADKTTEEASHQQMAVTIPFNLDPSSEDRVFELGLGGSSMKKSRDIQARVYGLVTAETNGSFSSPDTIDGLGKELAADPSGISDLFTGNTTTGPYYGYGVEDGGVENLNTVLDQLGVFVSGRLQLDDYFIAGGVRHESESYEIDVASPPLIPFPDETVDALGWENRDDQTALLPSIITGASLFENTLDVAFAWSRTVARPTFWEFLPTTSTDQSSGIVRRGNVNLDRTEIDNFDLSATLRPNEAVTIRTGLFHKKLDRPIIQIFSGDGILYKDSTGSLDPALAQDYTADINGIEIEAEIRDLGPFSLKGNFTYIDAVLNYFFDGGGTISPVASQLPFQPKIIANMVLTYQYEPWDLTANLVYNHNGEYPVILKESEAQSEVTRLSLSTWDLVLGKAIGTAHADYNIRFGIKNILGAEDTYIYDERTYSNDVLGRSYFIEAEVSF